MFTAVDTKYGLILVYGREVVAIQKPTGCKVAGSIGHTWLDRAIQDREAYFNECAWAWGCGTQDHFGDITYEMKLERAALKIVRGSEDTRASDQIYLESIESI